MITSEAGATHENLLAEMQVLLDRLGLSTWEETLVFPQFFQIETIRHCNARCPFCAVDQWDKSSPFMSDRLFEKIAVELGCYSDRIKLVDLQRAGEPLLDKKLVRRVRRLKEAGLKHVSISTNASLLTERKSRELLEAGLDELMISIDSVDKQRYEAMRVGLNYEKVMRNIDSFFSVRDEVRREVVVRVRGVCVLDLDSEEGKKEMELWERFWSPYKKPQDRIYMKRLHNWGNQLGRLGNSASHGDVYHPCVVPWSTLQISAMGKVPLCPMDYDARMDMGDINLSSVREIWQGSKWNEIRRLHRSGRRNEIVMCRGCKLFDPDFSLEKKEQVRSTVSTGVSAVDPQQLGAS